MYEKHWKNEVLMQLFVDGPTWDGNLVSKSDRDELVDEDLVDRWSGWNWLTEQGVRAAVEAGMRARDWYDLRFYEKVGLKK